MEPQVRWATGRQQDEERAQTSKVAVCGSSTFCWIATGTTGRCCLQRLLELEPSVPLSISKWLGGICFWGPEVLLQAPALQQ